MKKNGTAVKIILLAIPMTLGLIGFAGMEGMPFHDAAFTCIGMYVLNYVNTPPNLLVELARWTAPLATAGGVILAVSSLRDRLGWAVKYATCDSVAVYGPEDLTAPLMETLGKRGIRGGEKYIPAHRYILLMNDRKNVSFYAELLRGRGVPVYMRLSSMRGGALSDPWLKTFSPEETAARLFWRKTNMFRISETCGHCPRVVLIGFGKPGEELIYWGLQSNIFSPEQRIEYHVFGDCGAFLGTHPEIEKTGDLVIEHREPWYKYMELLRSAQLVIVLPSEGQIELLARLIAAIPEQSFDVFSENDEITGIFAEAGRIRLFPWQDLALTADNIMEDGLISTAMAINLRYAHIYGGVEETPENAKIEWEKLDSFKRYSNISAADYHAIRLRMLKDMEIDTEQELPPDILELLAELEHIRWCRYHQLNGWTYGIPQDGRSGDPVKRIHRDLRPFGDLSEADIEKDRENIRLLMKLR